MNYPSVLEQIVNRLRGVVIENRDAIECMGQHDSQETLFYVDPPYPHSVRSKHRGTYQFEMTDEDHEHLLGFLRQVRGFVVVSGYDHALYRGLGWHREEKKAFADGARERTEVLWINNAAWNAGGRLL